MAIQFIAVKCPACGADISVESGREFSFCTYCGTKIMINNDNEHIYRNIDEARIKEAETDRIVRLKELELEEKESSTGRKTTFLAYGIALVFVIIGALICIVEPLGGMWGIIIGGYIGLFTYIKSDDKKKKKRKYIGPNEVAITETMEDYADRNFNSIVMLFKTAGFTNVTAIPMNDLTVFNQKKNGQVDMVTINGSEEFEEGDIFSKDSNILITYHSR